MPENIMNYLEELPPSIVDEFASWAVLEFARPSIISLLKDIGHHDDAVLLQTLDKFADIAQSAMEIVWKLDDAYFMFSKDENEKTRIKYKRTIRAVGFLSQASSNLAKNQLKDSFFTYEIQNCMYEYSFEESRKHMMNRLQQLCSNNDIDIDTLI